MVTAPDQIVARFESLTAMIALVSTALSGLGLLVGGVLGVIIAVAITLLIGKLETSLPLEVPPFAPVLGFAVSVAVGLFFGVWPAYKAAQLDPVDALRYE